MPTDYKFSKHQKKKKKIAQVSRNFLALLLNIIIFFPIKIKNLLMYFIFILRSSGF